MLDLMLAASDDPSVPETKKLSDMEVIAQSLVFLAAGYETTSTTLSFVSHHLAINPEIQDKLQQEIDSVWPDENQMLSYETVHEMPYLDMVLAESLRMYPPGIKDKSYFIETSSVHEPLCGRGSGLVDSMLGWAGLGEVWVWALVRILNCHSVSPLKGITTSMQNEMAGLGHGGLKPFIHG